MTSVAMSNKGEQWMLTMQSYVAARVALAKCYLEESDRRYLDAYFEIKRQFLAAHAVQLMSEGTPVLPALLKPQAE